MIYLIKASSFPADALHGRHTPDACARGKTGHSANVPGGMELPFLRWLFR